MIRRVFTHPAACAALLFGAALFAPGCAGRRSIANLSSDFPAPWDANRALVRVLYVTDREPVPSPDDQRAYGKRRGQDFEGGFCEVEIPADHKMGELTGSGRVKVRRIVRADRDQFTADLRTRLEAQHESPSVTVFVHGFNETFEDWAETAAQVSFDLGCDTVPIIYCWPSAASVFSYRADETQADWAAANLSYILLQLALQEHAVQINVVAHSMGCRVLLNALRDLHRDLSHENESHKRPLNQVVFAAPDVDRALFRHYVVEDACVLAERVTVYISSTDKALAISRNLHDDYDRAGVIDRPQLEALSPIEKVKEFYGVSPIPSSYNVDIVDVSLASKGVIGHDYFASSRPVLTDLHLVLRHNLPPDERNLLRRSLGNGRFWWVVRP